MKNILIGQSGGPTSVINATLSGAITEAKRHSEVGEIYGMVNGIEGFLNCKFVDLKKLSDEELELLKITPASYLGSCRYKLPKSLDEEIYSTLFEKFNNLNIGYVLYNGGNDSMDTVDKLSQYAKHINSDIKFIGLPKTIDNDLMGTDHTPGFGSAAKFVANTVRNIALDAEVYDKPSVTIVEIMGRHAGWLTASAVLARRSNIGNPIFIYLPESEFDVGKFIDDVKDALGKNNNLVICVSEGIKDKYGKFICEYANSVGVDSFGHKNLTGCGKFLENEIKEKLGIKVRSVELNVTQRASSALLSKTDLEEAFLTGVEGVKAILKGETSKMICIMRNDNYKVSFETFDISKISNQEKVFPKEWIINDNDISKEFFEYILPLVYGEVDIPYENGVAKYLYR